jgi:hypothetical protein
MIKTAACTIVTKNYLSYARSLAKSFVMHNPESQFYVLLADQLDDSFDPTNEPFRIIYLDDLPEQDVVEKMCFYYTPFELCCALRGFLHEYIYEKTDVDRWIFLDSDIMVFSSLDVVFDQLEYSSILLTPHYSSAHIEYATVHPEELCTVKSGLYNAGFLGLARTLETRQFITWFKARLKFFSLDDSSKKLFVDQIWLNLIPAFFKKVDLCLEPGANIGHWNLYQRQLNKDHSGRFTANDKPVLFVHFSGWDIDNPSKVSIYSPEYDCNTPKVWVEIAECYRSILIENEYFETEKYPYGFGKFYDGKIIENSFRRLYYDDQMMSQQITCSPFSQSDYFYRNHKKIRGSLLKRALKKIVEIVP